MALVAAKYESAAEFYASRFLRIYVPYYLTLIAVVLLSLFSGLCFSRWHILQPYIDYSNSVNGLPGVVFAFLTNITLLFQDWVMFFQHGPNASFEFTRDFWQSQSPLYKYLVIPQAWSIGIELSFYLLVPTLNRLRTRWLITIAFCLTGLRVFGYEISGLTRDPWTYRFFPFELPLFCLGMLSCRAYQRFCDGNHSLTALSAASSRWSFPAFAITSIVGFYLLLRSAWVLGQIVGTNYAHLASYIVWAATIPVIFALTKSIPIDRWLGELSYPVYLMHFSVIAALETILEAFSLPRPWLGPLSAIIVIALSGIALSHVIVPLEDHRKAMAKILAIRFRGAAKRDNWHL